MTNRQKFTGGYEPEHRRMEVEIETSKGKMTGTITADPNMPPKTMKALTTMMGLLGEMARRGERRCAGARRQRHSDQPQPSITTMENSTDNGAALSSHDLFAELESAWIDFQNYGQHEGKCTFTGKCPECGTPQGRCDLHAEAMTTRQRRMQQAVEAILSANDKTVPTEGGEKKL